MSRRIRRPELLHEAPGFLGDVPVDWVLLPHGGEEKLLGEHLIVLFDRDFFGSECRWSMLDILKQPIAVLRAEF